MAKKIAVIPGDGIGPEVIAEGMRILETVNEKEMAVGLGIDYPGSAS